MRERFVLSRLGRKPSRAEAKDLTDFMHGFAAPLRACTGCGMLIRAERRVRDAGSYSEDPNDPDVMRQLLPRYVRAFRNKAPGFRDLLRPHADVLEIGSHLGAFLQVASEWNWTAIGLDVGADTSDFARTRGFKVRRETAEDTRLTGRSFDAVFVWNCFEQLPEPALTLRAIYTLLRPGGLVVIRVPNAGFYLRMRSDASALAARGGTPVGCVASAARESARSGDAGNAGHWTGAATKPEPGAAATLRAGRICPDSFVARRRRRPASTSSARLALEPNRARAASREFRHGLLAWNNLLGFPYLFGYTERHVHRIARDQGFEFLRGFDSELITMPFPDLSDETRALQLAASRAAAQRSIASTIEFGVLTGPWIEMVYRRVERRMGAHGGELDSRFLPRAA